MSELIMYDAVVVANLPEGGDAYAGYVGGHWVTWPAIKARFPKGKHLLSIAISADEHALALDVENGDATPAQVPGWVKMEHARNVARPVVYHSVSGMDEVLTELAKEGIHRKDVRLWSAHYQAGKHICGPATCKMVSVPMDGTQWTDTALGRSLDESVLVSDFFSDPAPQPVHQLDGHVVYWEKGLHQRGVVSEDGGKTWR